MRKKRIADQVLVITGASSGIGLATARAAVRRGARVVLAARNDEDLARICAELGERAAWVSADVADARALEAVRETALDRFGALDTWVNNAGLSIIGKLGEVALSEARRLFDVNFWGVVNGSRAALHHLREHGGTIINVGSALPARGVPLQGMFAASKAAVHGYTEALRAELEADGLPVTVTLLKPATIDTPFTEHARIHIEGSAPVHAPVYTPELVANVILRCAEHPTREISVGRSRLGRLVSPRTEQPRRDEDALFLPPLVEGKTRGLYDRKVRQRSLATWLAMHPLATASAVAFAALMVTGLAFGRSR
jgi:NADP-dependent 3-hydroxy acid dehydrogenase YdfG